MTAYTDWLAETATDRVVLAELQPAEHLTGAWTSQGPTYPNVYRTPWASFIATAVIAGGVARRLDSVRQNDVALTLRASVALCNSNAGSYFLDSSGGYLYVSTTTGSSPATFDAMAAYFTLFVATTAKDFADGALYEPRLAGSLPAVRAEAEGPFTAVKTFADGTLDLVNAEAFFDEIAATYIWRNKLVTLHLGGGSLARSDYAQVAAMRIDSLAVGDDIARLNVRSLAYLLERTLPLNTITPDGYPYAIEDTVGSYKGLLWGLVRDIPAPCVDAYHLRTPGFEGAPPDFSDTYLVADASAQVLTGVLAVRAINRSTGEVRGLTTDGYSVDLSACTVTVTDVTFRADEWELRVDATGETDGAGGYLDTFGEIAQDILLTLGESASNIDGDTFDDADASAPFPLGLYLHEPAQASEAILLLQQSVIGAVYVGRDGRWRAYVLDLANTATAGSLSDADFVSWEPVSRVDPIYPVVRLFYAPNPSTGEEALTTAEDSATRYLYETVDGLSVHTALASASHAALMAQRYRLLSTRADVQIDAELRGLDLMTAELFDRVEVTRSRAPGGSLTAARWEVLRLEKSLDPVAVRLRLGDLGGLSALYGGVRVIADGHEDWSSATAEEQATLAFLGDSAGDVASGVPNPTILW